MAHRQRTSRATLLSLFTGAALAACARPQAPLPSYPPLDSVDRDAQNASPVTVSLLRVEYHYAADGSYTRSQHQIYTILDSRAVESWGASEARWSPWRSERPKVTATVTTREGAVSHLDPSSLSEAAAYPEAPEMYGDERVLRGPLPNVGVGATVDEEVVVQTHKPYLGGAETRGELLQSGTARARVEVVVDAPEGLALHYAVHGAKVATADEHKNGRHVVSFTGGPFKGIREPEADSPSNVVEWPFVGIGTGSTWRPLAQAYASVIGDKLTGEGFEGLMAQTVAASDAPRAKAEKVVAWLRDRVRYVGIEFGDSSIVPRMPAETLKHGYGDCKDQAVLLVALLHAAHLPKARVALVDAGTGQDIDPSMPALNVFDHAIVVVPQAGADGADLWIDPTATRARAGELPIGDQGRYALVVDSATEGLVRTPGAGPDDNTYREVRQIFLPAFGSARVVETSTATGSIERGMREDFDVSTEALGKWHKDYVSRTYASQRAGALEVSKIRDLSQPLHMSIEALDASIASANLVDATIQMKAGPALGWVPKSLTDDDEERKGELALHMPYRAEIVYEVHPGPDFVLDAPPALPDLTLGPATLEGALDARPDGTVVVTYRFVLPKSRWSAAEVNAFRKAHEAWAKSLVPTLSLLHKGQKLHKDRRYAEELKVFRDDAQAHPGDAFAKMRLAQSLLGLGFGGTARRLAGEANKLAPDNATLWDYTGFVLSHDELGRANHAGWDRDGAVAAFREAVRIDPTDTFAATNAGVLLEHDDKGRRYARSSRLEDAVAMFDRIDPAALADYKNGEYVTNAAFDLMRLGRFEEVRTRLAKLEPKKAPRVPAIVAAGMLGGANAALSEATRVIQPGDDRVEILSGAAGVLAELRRYDVAAALNVAAAQDSSDEHLRRRIELLSKTRPIDPETLPAKSPAEVVRKAVGLCAARTANLRGALKPLLHEDQMQEGHDTFMDFCTGVAKSDPLEGRGDPMVPADLLVAAIETTPEGSDATGFRVQAGSVDGHFTVFLDKEGGAYRIRSTNSGHEWLGCSALAFQQAGRKGAAVQWLSWARELLTPASGDDPLRGGPFLNLWTDQKNDVEASAAALCAVGGHPDRTVAPLSAARAHAVGDRATALDHALVYAQVDTGHEEQRLAAATVLLTEAPTSHRAWELKRGALAGLGRFQALRDESAARAAKTPTDLEALGDLAWAEAQAGHFAESRAVGARLLATGKADANAYNEEGWRSLFTTPTEQDLGYALRSVSADPNNASHMNTLAALDAALGHVADARDRFARSIELEKGDLSDADYFVLGRIAEQFGLIDEAKEAYRHCTHAPKSAGEYSSQHLAAARLKALR